MKLQLKIFTVLISSFLLASCSHSISDRYLRAGTEQKKYEISIDMTGLNTNFVVEKVTGNEVKAKTPDAFFEFSKDIKKSNTTNKEEVFFIYAFSSINDVEANEKITELEALEFKSKFKVVFDPPFYIVVTANSMQKPDADKLLEMLKDAGYSSAEIKTNLPE